jgi:hypothetical protein
MVTVIPECQEKPRSDLTHPRPAASRAAMTGNGKIRLNLFQTVTLFGQYTAAGFHLATDGAVGTDVTYAQPPAAHLELALKT